VRPRVQDFDNRDSSQMYEYLEARIEALKRRVAQLEGENAMLTFQLLADKCGDGSLFAASA